MVLHVRQFPGIKSGDEWYDEAIVHAVAAASQIAGRSLETRGFAPSERTQRTNFALQTSLLAVNALLAAASTQCMIGGAPADIDMVTDGAGTLIYRCQHHPIYHEWSLSGTQIK